MTTMLLDFAFESDTVQVS